MRFLAALIFFTVAIFARCEDATDIVQSILDVDRALADEIKSDLLQAKEKKDQLKSEISKELKNSVQQLKDALTGKLEQLHEIEQAYKAQDYSDKKQALNEWKAFVQGLNETKAAWKNRKWEKIEQIKKEKDELLNQLRAAYEKRKEEKAAEKEREKEQLRQAWLRATAKLQDIQEKLNDSSNLHKERREEMMEAMRATLEEIKAVVSREKAARDQKRQERHEKYEDVLNQVKSDLSARKDDLDNLEDELKEKYALFKERQSELKDMVQDALKKGVKTSVVVHLGDKIQDTIDKVALKEALLQTKAELTNKTMAEPRTTILDEITGVSAWQTVTWILLALCILLCVALIAMIIYQVSERFQRNKYNTLDGHNHPNERTPIAQPISGSGYTDDRKTPAPPVSSAPSVPIGDTQQY